MACLGSLSSQYREQSISKYAVICCIWGVVFRIKLLALYTGSSLSFTHFRRRLLDNYSYRKWIWASYDWSVPVPQDTPYIWVRNNWNLITPFIPLGEKLVLSSSALTWDKTSMWISHESDIFFPSIAIFYAVMLYVELYKKESLPKISALPNQHDRYNICNTDGRQHSVDTFIAWRFSALSKADCKNNRPDFPPICPGVNQI